MIAGCAFSGSDASSPDLGGADRSDRLSVVSTQRSDLRAALAELGRTGFYLYYTVLLSGLAEILATSGEFDEAAAAADEAAERADRGSNIWWLPEALRVKGEVLMAASPENSAQAEGLFCHGLDLAQRDGALSWELRCAIGLARLWRDRGKPADALALLQPVYNRFVEGFGTSDLKSARVLLDDLQ